MIKSRMIATFLAMTLMASSSCGLLASQFIKTILITVGTGAATTLLVKAAEAFFDKWFDSTPMPEKAANEMNSFQEKVQPIQNNFYFGKITDTEDVRYQVNGQRAGQESNLTISVSNNLILYKRDDLNSTNWQLTPESQIVIRQHLEVAGAQLSLRNLKYECGEVDGDLGPQTRGAIRKFQKDNGLPQTGELDAITKDMLL